MKNIRTYLPSLFLSILLVFIMLAGSAAMIADINITANKLKTEVSEEKVPEKIYSGLERLYRERAAATGIPASVYMDAITEEYIASVMDAYIEAGFKSLKSGKKLETEVPKNEALEESIDRFFNEYADETGYEKDEAFEKKLAATKSDAYKNIGSASDTFRFKTISDHGYMTKLSKVYRHKTLLVIAVSAAFAAAFLILFIVNLRDKKVLFFWLGISSIISGLIGGAPAVWLMAEKYFDSFTIKQPQVFTAYTRTMYSLTEAFMAAQIAITATGIVMIVVYGVMCSLGTKSDEISKASDSKENPIVTSG